jgi:hypothetical protein
VIDAIDISNDCFGSKTVAPLVTQGLRGIVKMVSKMCDLITSHDQLSRVQCPTLHEQSILIFLALEYIGR